MKLSLKKLGVLAAVLCVLLGSLGGCSFRSYDDEPHGYEADEDVRIPRFNLPYTPEGSKTEIKQIYTSSVDNPDNGFVHGDRVATIVLRNRSMQFMSFAHVQVRLMDDSVFEFQVYNVPTERDIIAFEINGKELPEEPLIKVISVDNVFNERQPTLGNRVGCTAEGSEVTVTNQTRQPMDMSISFHTLSDDGETLLGGMAYYYRMSLDAEESQTINVEEALGRELEIMTTEEIK